MIGTRISRYEIVEEAGRGAMGQVYRARDTRLGRTVALKLLRTEYAQDESRRRRFRLEARAVARLNHPGIVAIYDVIRIADDDFLVMEWVSGKTLRSVISESPLSAGDASAFAVQIGEALSVAHGAGVVHRDLKPENVMISDDGRAKILDFGIARLLTPDQIETLTSDTLAGDGAGAGTFAYMSPEQALGESVGPLSDVFSYGVLLYEMLSGQRPFRAASLPALVHELVHATPASLAAAGNASPELEAVVFRALPKRAAERCDMETLVDALRRVPELLARGSDLRPPPRRTELSGRRLPWVAAAVVAAIALPWAWSGWLGEQKSSPPSISLATRAADIPASGIDLPASPYEFFQQGLRLLERYDREGYVDLAVERFAEASQQSRDYAPAHSGLARAYLRKYRQQRDEVWLDRAEDSVRRALELQSQLTHARVGLARILTSRGRLAEAREELEELVQLDPADAEVYSALAEVARVAGDQESAARWLGEAIARDADRWEFFSNLGLVRWRQSRFDLAEAAFERAIELTPDNALAYRNLATMLYFQERYEEAISAFQTSISIRPTSAACSNLGTLYFFMGRYRDAASAFEQATRLGANDHLVWANLGDAYRQVAGHEDDARKSHLRALQLLRESIVLRPEDADLRSRSALYQAKLGACDDAFGEVAQLRRDEETWKTQVGPIWFRIALASELCERRPTALQVLRQALENGFSYEEVRRDPELTGLRADVAFHRLAVEFGPPASSDLPDSRR